MTLLKGKGLAGKQPSLPAPHVPTAAGPVIVLLPYILLNLKGNFKLKKAEKEEQTGKAKKG